MMSILKRLTGTVCALALCIQGASAAFAAQVGMHTESGVAVVSIDVDDKYLEDIDVNDDPSYIKFVKNQQTVGTTDFNSLVTHQARFNAFNKTYGIDVSLYNGDIDFNKVKAEGYSFVIVRAGARGYGYAGKMIEDSRFEEFVDNAHKAGLMVGAYYYTQAINKAEVKQEAEVTLRKIAGRKLEMPVYFDIEPAYDWSGRPGRLVAAKLSKDKKAELCEYFCDLINEAGYDSGVTSCKSWFLNEINMSRLENKYDIWLAHYTKSTDYVNDYNMWQFNSTRKVNGVTSSCTDQDVRYTDLTKPTGSQQLTVSADNNNVVLKWDATGNTKGYNIYKLDTSGKAVKVGSTGKLTYTCKREDTQAQYYVQPYNVYDGKTYYSGVSNTVTVTAKKVSGLKAESLTKSSVTLGWTETTGASGYCVYMDDKFIGTSKKASYALTGLQENSAHSFKVCAFFNSDASGKLTEKSELWAFSNAYSVTLKDLITDMSSIKTTPFVGSNRYETAILVSKQCYPKTTKNVVLVSGETYADALVAAPMASSFDAPILLTPKSALNDATLKEIQRLNAKTVYIVGGEGAVSKNVETTLTSKGFTVKRVYSSTVRNRYGTAVYVAANIDISRGGEGPTDVFIASANGYADTLCIGNIASVKNAPILYINQQGTLDGATKYYLNGVKDKIKNVYIIGGTGVVGKQAETELAQYGTVKRIAGANRYETCLEVNKYFAGELTGKGLCVTTGMNYPDALSGGVFAGIQKTPILLADSKLSNNQKDYLQKLAPPQVCTLGGSGIDTELVKSAICGK